MEKISASHPVAPLSPTLPFAIALLSASALACEVLLMRLFSIADWHHLAFLVISVALLGYGISGTVLALGREPLVRHSTTTAAIASGAFAISSLLAVFVAQRLGLNSLEIFWSAAQAGRLFVLYLLFAVPFFCAAMAIGVTLTRFGAQSPRLYRADLIGAGSSAVAITALLFAVHPVTALQFVAATAVAAACLFEPRPRTFAVALAAAAVIVGARPFLLPLRMSQFKELSHALRVPGAKVVDERSSPLGLLTSVASVEVPFRHAPGLSLAFTGEIPEQTAIFTDGGGMTPIVHASPDRESAEYVAFLPTAIAYHVGDPKGHVAVLGAGGGAEVLSALAHGADQVTAVEMNPQVVDLVSDRFAREARNLYRDRRVHVVVAEARSFLRNADSSFDAVQLALVGSQGASAAGVQAVSEDFLYTVEAMTEMIAHLRPGGVLVVTRWMQTPPREIVKLLATAVAAQERLGQRPESRIALIRGWNTATIVARNGDFTPTEVRSIRAFCDERSFDIDVLPGVQREETNRYHLLDEPYLFDASRALFAGGTEREKLFGHYKFNIRPATDEKPYFFHSFRWSALPELLALRGRGGIPLLEWGYLVLIAALLQAALAALAFILLPLLLWRRKVARRGTPAGRAPAWKLVAYFASIGLAFLFLEIAFMQRLTLILGHPLYAVALVLSAFLLFGGIGSGLSARMETRGRLVPMGVALLALLVLVVVREIAALALAPWMQVAASLASIAPLALLMGMPFPLGLRRLAGFDPTAIPWAWGINGTASVISSMLATLVAMHFGSVVLVLAASLLYVVAALTWFPARSVPA